MNLCELSTNHAIDFFTSDLGNNTHNQFYDALCDNVIPDDVSVWEPFEHYEEVRVEDLVKKHKGIPLVSGGL